MLLISFTVRLWLVYIVLKSKPKFINKGPVRNLIKELNGFKNLKLNKTKFQVFLSALIIDTNMDPDLKTGPGFGPESYPNQVLALMPPQLIGLKNRPIK